MSRAPAARAVAIVAALAVLGVGATVLFAWWLDIDPLKTGFGARPAMNPLTAVAFVLAGISLLLLLPEPARRWARRLARACAAAVALIGLTRLSEYLFGWDIGLDRLLFRDRLAALAAGGQPGGMAANTALNFLLVGVSLLLLDLEARWSRSLTQLLTLTAGVVGLLSLAGHAYEATKLVGVSAYMAIHTALAFVILAAGILAARPSRGLARLLISDDLGGLLARRLLPAAIGVPLILGWLRLRGEYAGFFDRGGGTALFVTVTIVLLGALILWSAASLERLDAERTRASANLLGSEGRARSIVDTAYDAFVAIDANSVITDWNRQAEATFGWTRDEAIGRHLVDTIIPPQHREAHRRGLARFLTTGEGPVLNRVVEITALRRSGEEFPVELTIAPLRLGGTYSFNAFVRDITERKRAEEELRQSREAAQAANRAKSEFLARMSHELRTPLNSIIGFSEVLEDQLFGPLNEKQRRYIGNIQTSGRHLLNLINDILDLSKVEAGHMVLVPATFDIGSALREVRAIVSTLAERKRLALQVEVDNTLPPLTADQGKLRQILYNLLSNAIKFTSEGGRVCVTARRTAPSEEGGEWVEIAVADTGIGLRPEDRERLFREFERVDSSRGEEGTGLGLALSRKLVELHGGRIWVESEIGKGSTFRFTFPLVPGRVAPAAPVPAGEAGSVAVAGAGLLVLVAEDDEQSGYLLTHYLSEAGYRVVRASTGERTIVLARELRPDAITLDILLSGADGLMTLAQLKASPETRDIPVVVVSVTENRELGLSLGATDWLVKPVNREQLVAAVRQAAGVVTKARP